MLSNINDILCTILNNSMNLSQNEIQTIKSCLFSNYPNCKNYTSAEIDIIWSVFSNYKSAQCLVVDDNTLKEFLDFLENNIFA